MRNCPSAIIFISKIKICVSWKNHKCFFPSFHNHILQDHVIHDMQIRSMWIKYHSRNYGFHYVLFPNPCALQKILTQGGPEIINEFCHRASLRRPCIKNAHSAINHCFIAALRIPYILFFWKYLNSLSSFYIKNKKSK